MLSLRATVTEVFQRFYCGGSKGRGYCAFSPMLRNYRLNYAVSFAITHNFKNVSIYETKPVMQKRSAALNLKNDLYARYKDSELFEAVPDYKWSI
eukprot:IDg16457t1